MIFWKNAFSSYAASHFRHALFSVLQRYISLTFFCTQRLSNEAMTLIACLSMDAVHAAILGTHFSLHMRPFGSTARGTAMSQELAAKNLVARLSPACSGMCQGSTSRLQRGIMVKKRFHLTLFPPSKYMMMMLTWGFSSVESHARWSVLIFVYLYIFHVSWDLSCLFVSLNSLLLLCSRMRAYWVLWRTVSMPF